MKIRAIITGATGMVGEGVLYECLNNENVDSILVIGRKPCGYTHQKMKEIIVTDFAEISDIKNNIIGYNACFFCLGVSSVGMNEQNYFKITYTLTLNFASVLLGQNKDMTFCYISGAQTDSTEKGKIMWARVKGKTENDLMKMPFKKVYAFRPGALIPQKGFKNTLSMYKYFCWLVPVLKMFFPKHISTLQQLGIAMINAVIKGYYKNTIEVTDIHTLARNNN